MSKEMLNALDVLEAEKGIPKDTVIEALQAALVSAYKRHYGQASNVEVEFEPKKGNIHVYAVKEVTEEVFDSQLEVSLKDAVALNGAYEIGDKIRFEVTPKDFGRIAAQTAKQVILQRVREAERTIIYNDFSEYENDIMQGIVERQDRRYIYVNLGKIEAVLSKQDQMPNEFYQPHDRIKVYVSRVENTSKGPQVFVSRSHPDLLKRLFEQEIPVGTCVGPKGQRVQAIVNELKGENMDIVEWNEDPAIYISNALNPAQVLDVIFDPENSKACTVVVPDYQLSLAIGKRGQNARLAAKLTGHKIDIKSESDMAEFYEQQANQEVAEVAEEMDEAIIHSDMTADDYENLATEEAVVEAEITEELPEQE